MTNVETEDQVAVLQISSIDAQLSKVVVVMALLIECAVILVRISRFEALIGLQNACSDSRSNSYF